MFSWGFTNEFNSFFGFLGLRLGLGLGLGLGFSFFRFLGLRLGLGLNKMDLAYVCMYVLSIIRNFILYMGFTYM